MPVYKISALYVKHSKKWQKKTFGDPCEPRVTGGTQGQHIIYRIRKHIRCPETKFQLYILNTAKEIAETIYGDPCEPWVTGGTRGQHIIYSI